MQKDNKRLNDAPEIHVYDSLREKEQAKFKDNIFFLGIAFFGLVIMLTIIILNTFVFFIAEVDGESMEPTLSSGDRLVVNRCKEVTVNSIVTIKRYYYVLEQDKDEKKHYVKEVEGDETLVVDKDGKIFNKNELDIQTELLIKRVIAMEEGDIIKISGGKVYVNGAIIEQPYLDQDVYTSANGWKEKTLKKGEIFYLGDNRGNSLDARQIGACTLKDVAGVVEDWSLWFNGLFK